MLFGMQTEKTTPTTAAKEPVHCKLETEEKIIEQVMGINYPGATTPSSNKILYHEVRQAQKKCANIREIRRYASISYTERYCLDKYIYVER